MDKKSVMGMKHWQAPVVGLLGLWLAASPWVLDFSGSTTLTAAKVVLGLALVCAGAAMAQPSATAWGAWLAVVVGLMVVASPWVLGYSGQTSATSSALATGLVSAILGFMVGMMSDSDGWWNDRMAH